VLRKKEAEEELKRTESTRVLNIQSLVVKLSPLLTRTFCELIL
jgi:hypothetical protein